MALLTGDDRKYRITPLCKCNLSPRERIMTDQKSERFSPESSWHVHLATDVGKMEAESASNEMLLNCQTSSGLTRTHSKLPIDRAQMGTDGSWTQHESFSHLDIG